MFRTNKQKLLAFDLPLVAGQTIAKNSGELLELGRLGSRLPRARSSARGVSQEKSAPPPLESELASKNSFHPLKRRKYYEQS